MTYDAAVLADSPSGYYKCDENSGTVCTDSSGNGHNATYHGSPTFAVTVLASLPSLGVQLGAAPSSGQAAITFPTAAWNPGTGDWSFEIIVSLKNDLTSFFSDGILFITDSGGTQGFILIEVLDGSPAALYVNATGGSGSHTTFPNDHAGHQIVCTYNSSTGVITFYVDGVSIGTTTIATGFGPQVAPIATSVGDIVDASGSNFNLYGNVQCISFYTHVLTSARVRAHWLQATQPTLSDTIGITDALKIGQGRPLTDTVGIPENNLSVRFNDATHKAQADTVGITESFSEHAGYHRSLIDTVGILDGLVAGIELHLPLLSVTTSALIPTADSPTTPTPTPAGQQTQYQILAVDNTGLVYAEYATGAVTQITWTLNQPEEAQFTVPIDAPNLAQLPLANSVTTPPREVQIWRNGHLLFWGVPVQRRANRAQRVYTYTAKGLGWYFTRRYFGKANRHNFATNGSFETGSLAPWTATGAGLTASIDSSFSLMGTRSVKLVETTPGQNAYISQTFVVAAGGIGLALFLTAWFYLDSFSAPAALHLGALIQRVGAIGAGSQGVVTIDSSTARGQWVRVEGHVDIPPDTTETILVQLFAPQGTIHWDAVTVTAQESYTLGVGPFDEARIAAGIIDVLQNRGPAAHQFGDDLDKSDLNIGHLCPDTGILKQRTYFYSDHQKGYDGGSGASTGALDEFINANDGFDIEFAITPHTRTFKTHHPTIGTDWTQAAEGGQAFVFTYRNPSDLNQGADWAIVDWDQGESIETAANQVIELGGWGTGSGREEGGFSDDASLGGLTLELVEALPTGDLIDQLSAVAARRGADLKNPIVTPTITVAEPRDPTTGAVSFPLIGVIYPGDTVGFDLVDGDVTLSGSYRLAQVTLNVAAATGETLALVPNVVTS
jgi:hypothetical protein